MVSNKKFLALFIPILSLLAGCTKLHEDLGSTLTKAQQKSALSTAVLLQQAYADLAVPFHNQDQVFSLEENTSDESLVPTRGGDWDDNGVWRVLHNHNWDANHGQILSVFNNLNKLSFDATNVLAFDPTPTQGAEARFLRCVALYYLVDLYGQYPFRDPGENLLNAPQVKTGSSAITFIISELTAIIPTLPASNPMTRANPDAAKILLMKCLLNKGAFINRAVPTFDAADLQQVITLGKSIIDSNKYSFTPNYFNNFSVDNGISSREGIFAYPNTSGVSVNHGAIESRWEMTLHYNSYTPNNPNAGWNGFSTISDFYSTFGTTSAPTFTPADTLLDQRIGGRYFAGSTDVSGIRPGFLVGQQFNEKNVALKDRKSNPLAYTPDIAPNMIETDIKRLEIAGIRVVKYVPDFTNNGKYFGSNAGNWLMIFRYPDAV